jgi:aspartate/tyrosine/aromatic aminotransferase
VNLITIHQPFFGQSMFETAPLNPPDAIFGLNEQFKKDTRADKINLTVGVYKNEEGETPVLKCVQAAEKVLLDLRGTKSYLPIDGMGKYNNAIGQLVLGDELSESANWATAQTPGGTVSLRVAGELVRVALNADTIWMSDPTWANHPKIFAAANLNVQKYEYLNDAGVALDFERMKNSLSTAKAGQAILLHTVCHNPTGVDPTVEQWKELLDIVKEKQLIPIFDFAYQGFGEEIQPDAFPIRHFVASGGEALICNSFSKNFGLYGERVGGITAVANSASSRDAMLSQIKSTIRTMYSNPPLHGAAIVSTVLNDDELRKTWTAELAEMRERIHQLRGDFVEKMQKLAPDNDFGYVNDQRGMFSYSGLNAEQAKTLREEHSIYILGSGRINIAGINSKNSDRLCKAIVSVL